MLEYFIATPGARKGLVDTALRTADSGYLTRRLVDVAQELIIREDDCEREGVRCAASGSRTSCPTRAGERSYLETRLFGRTLADDVRSPTAPCSPAGHRGRRRGPRRPARRSRGRPGPGALACSPAEAELGVCAACYGRSLATGKTIELGEAVGVIAAQSIGEPGTQLTMRTFHTGGIAGTRHRRRSAPRRRAVRGPHARRARPRWPAPPA